MANTARTFVAGTLIGMGITLGLVRMNYSDLEITVSEADLNRDGLKDMFIYNPNTDETITLIQKKDGTYDRAQLILGDGLPYFKTKDGVYDCHGGYTPINRKI